MAQKTVIEGYESFCKFVENLEKGKVDKQVYFLFSGSKDSTGKSWCPDCVKGKLHLKWKDPKCPFRTDKRLMLKSVPTLLKWGHPDKLEEDECRNPDLVSMMFE
ncbi:Thioredoxin domain-containing protein 17 [Blattella germanica]|nr:Thioredoxin domain-containing protein 17 [Blattella germanica]